MGPACSTTMGTNAANLGLRRPELSSKNLGIDAHAFIAGVPADAVGEIHLAGHARNGDVLVDDHGAAVSDPVWELYRFALRRIGPRPTLIEWDTRIPALSRLVEESQRASRLLGEVRGLAA